MWWAVLSLCRGTDDDRWVAGRALTRRTAVTVIIRKTISVEWMWTESKWPLHRSKETERLRIREIVCIIIFTHVYIGAHLRKRRQPTVKCRKAGKVALSSAVQTEQQTFRCLLKKVNYKQATDKEMDGGCVNEKQSINCVLSSQNFPILKNCGRNLPSRHNMTITF